MEGSWLLNEWRGAWNCINNGKVGEYLNLNDPYSVIIPGFYTSEETYNYYPELAGLGYPGVAIIEKK